MFRDPVARYRSAVARLQRMAEESGDRVRLPSIGDATWRGFYYQQLRHVFELFPREQVLVLQFERCVQRPGRGDGAHLAVPRRRAPREAAGAPLEAPAGRAAARPSSAGVSGELAERYREDSARLAELCPEIDLSLWPSVAGEGRARGDVPVDAAVP